MFKTKHKTVIKEKQSEGNFSFLSVIQKIGKSLVYPIATLPAAALFMRIGVFIGSYGKIDGSTAKQVAY